jgi:predicted lipoprotein with Yx(FWY)xxD motif
MMNLRAIRIRVGGLAAVAAVIVVVAGCGSSSSTSSNAAAAPPASSSSTAASSAATPASAKGVTVTLTKGAQGSYLAGASGRALYLWVADAKGKSSCSGACAGAWPPLTGTAKPAAGPGVNAADLGTISRSDGTKQVTYNGHPLYYFVSDPHSGTTKGQGSDSFGAKWWLVAPSGAAITSGGSGAAPAASSSSSAGGGWS